MHYHWNSVPSFSDVLHVVAILYFDICHYSGKYQNKEKSLKDIYFVIYGIISDFTDKGQFQYLTNFKGP